MSGNERSEIKCKRLAMGINKSRDINRDTKILVRHPAGIDDIDQHQHALPRSKNKGVVKAVIDAVPRKLERLIADVEGKVIVKDNVRRWPSRVAPRREKFGRSSIGDDLEVGPKELSARDMVDVLVAVDEVCYRFVRDFRNRLGVVHADRRR